MKKSLVILMIAFAFSACDNDSDCNPVNPKEKTEIKLIQTEQELIEQGNIFAFNFFRAVIENTNPGSNIFVSPLSTTIAFSMLNNGANGETQDEIQEALGFKGESPDGINKLYRKILNDMPGIDPLIKIELTNSIWIDNGFPVFPSFIETNKESYDAEVRNADFANSNTVNEINQWVSDKTYGRIPEMLDKDRKLSVMLLLNAVYFKGQWTKFFNKKLTKQEIFTNQNGSQSEVDMMQSQAYRLYAENDQYAITTCPYGEESYQMVLILPHEGVNLSSVAESLTDTSWQECLSLNGKTSLVDLKLPKFTLEYKCDLKEIMQTLGIKAAFDATKADLSGISKIDLFVEKTSQKTFISIDEKGTEAAGATEIMPAPTGEGPSKEPEEEIQFYLNRPFLYFIQEKTTGAILFIGKTEQL